MDRHRILLIGSAVALLLFLGYMMSGPDATWIPR